ncbi:helix-turn-helix domain-containing protein [Amaricoccus solimangrovi]|nr:helix-turn-helix transcriptional regulator [Amaricoccus solimangrovi]
MNRIAAIRRKLKVGQNVLADALDVDQSTVSKLENEKIPLTIHQLRTIARTLHVSFGELEDPPMFSERTIEIARLIDNKPQDYQVALLKLADTLSSAPPAIAPSLVQLVEAFLGALPAPPQNVRPEADTIEDSERPE